MPKRKKASIGRQSRRTQQKRQSRGNPGQVVFRDGDEGRGHVRPGLFQRNRVSRIQADTQSSDDESQPMLPSLDDVAAPPPKRPRVVNQDPPLESPPIDTNVVIAKLKEGAAFDYQANVAYEKFAGIGDMNHQCRYCGALKWVGERPGLCCSGGKVRLPNLDGPPEPLSALLMGTDPESKHFLSNIRRYNTSLAMTSYRTKEEDFGGFITTFKVQGVMYHRAGSLLPMSENNAKFLQLYFTGDDDQECKKRCELNPYVKPNVVKGLQQMLHSNNELVHQFKMCLEKMTGPEFEVVIKADRRPSGTHARQFNAPVVNDVAVVMAGELTDKRNIVLQKRCNEVKPILETHRSYDSLAYPLLFPRGEDGYHFQYRQVDPKTGLETQKKVSCEAFYSQRLMIYPSRTNHLHRSRQLFSQFITDMYCKVESERLRFIRSNQQKLRAEEYVHLRDAMKDDQNIQDVGKMTILPSSYTGGPRYMQQKTQDAMTYVRNWGNPSLFITFTCNPKWSEIVDQLHEGQTATDRHDIVCRVQAEGEEVH